MDAGFSTLSTSQMGIQRGLDGLRREAQSIAHSNVDGAPEDLAGAMVRSIEQKALAEANAVALRRANRAMGSVIDILA
jgi:hypothetical protein